MNPPAQALIHPSFPMLRALAPWMARGVKLLRQLGPYAAIELLLPGGSLIALVLWLYRRNRAACAA